MSETDTTESPRRLRLIAIAAALACAATSVIALRNGMIEAGYRSNPAAMAAIGASDPRVRGQLLSFRLEQAKLRVSPAMVANARTLLAVNPLSDIALVVAGGSSLQAGQLAKATAQLEEARERNPRNRFARLFLLELYLRSMKLPQAGVEIATLGRLLGNARPVLVPVVARALVDPVIGAQLKSAVEGDAQLRSAVALAMVDLNTTPAQVIAVGGTHASADPVDKAWRTALLQRMVDVGQIDAAYRLWRGFSGARQDNDLSFLPLDGLPPFAWNFLGTGDGVAEPSRTGALDISFYNRASVQLAKKLITLQPGGWRLAITVEGGPTRGQEPLVANLTCAGAKDPLARIPFTINRGGMLRSFADFSVPDGCRGQWLTIDGTAQDLPTPRTVSVTSLSLKNFK